MLYFVIEIFELTRRLFNEFTNKFARYNQSESSSETTVASKSEKTVSDMHITKEQFACVLQGLLFMT